MITLEFNEKYSLMHTFECGQIFRFKTFDDGTTYYGTLENHPIKAYQEDDHSIQIETHDDKVVKPLVNRFFRTDDDYLSMKKAVQIDDLMRTIVETTDGMHLLLQPKFECMIAYLLSQCSNIPRITSNLEYLAENFGKKLEFDGKTLYTFPTRQDLIHLDEMDFRQMGFGYRAKYIDYFIHNYPDFLDDEVRDSALFNKQLKSLYGIGQKVADCIQLFAFGDLYLFPVDTWMMKFMKKYYYRGGKKNPVKEIRELGQELFGKWAGYAEELIFFYARCFDSTL